MAHRPGPVATASALISYTARVCTRFLPFSLVLFLTSVALSPGQDSSKRPVTLDAYLSQERTFPITPTWASDGQRFFYEEGNAVRLYSASERKSREWFRPETLEEAAAKPVHSKEFGWQNRRVTAASYQWFPNSADLLAAVNGDLFIVHSNGRFDQVTKTDIDEEDPRLSPDGTMVLYRWKSNLYLLTLANKAIRRLTGDGTPTLLNGQLDWVYPEELDLGKATWWSPDSKHIAFLQFDVGHEFIYPQSDLVRERALSEPERYPQAGTPNANVKLGHISIESGATTWMQLGDTVDALLARVEWLPDSSQIAVERFNRVQNKLDLLFCNPDTGSVRSVIHQDSKTWINVADNLFFLKSRPEFIWTSEQSGFRHIYRYSNRGDLLQQLTRGDWEVRSVSAIDEKSGQILFTSSEDSPLETQLYRISLDGKTKIRVTQQEGTHQIHANRQADLALDTYSSFKQPDQSILINSAGMQLAVIRPADSKVSQEYGLLPEEISTLKASDGTILYARLIKPANFQPGTKYPAIVSVYGGPGVQLIANRWYGLSLEQVLANRGYVVWQLDNRGSIGRGTSFEAPLYRELGKTEVADQRTGVEHLLQSGFVDPKRIGIFGWSFGGYMTIHSLLLAPDMFKVGVAGAPVTDWHNYDTIYTERYMGLPGENQQGYDAASNVKNAGKLEGKLLILHNIEDDNVLFQNSMQMADALETADKRFFMQIYPQKSHGVGGKLRNSLYGTIIDFFDSNLRASEAPLASAK